MQYYGPASSTDRKWSSIIDIIYCTENNYNWQLVPNECKAVALWAQLINNKN